MHPDAALVLEGLGGDPSQFAARQFTPRVASDVDLVLTMTKAHRDRVLELAPRLLRRTFTLTEAFWLTSDFQPGSVADLAGLRPRLEAKQLADVRDPIGQTEEVFMTVGSQIAGLLPPIIEFLRRATLPADD